MLRSYIVTSLRPIYKCVIVILMASQKKFDSCRRVDRNAEGGFFQIFQQNKWRLRKQKEATAVQRQKEWSLL